MILRLASRYRGSGATSRPPGQTSVPCSTFTCANVAGSPKGASTPCQSSPMKSTSPMVPSSNVKRTLCGPITSTPTTYANESNACIISTILGEWLDCHKRSTVAGQSPVGENLVVMRVGPFRDEALCAIRQRPCQNGAVSCDGGSPLSVFRMKMRNWMVSLTPIHRYDDPVEAADSWHTPHRKRCLGWETLRP
jgi:hypothetical protein